MKSFPASPLLPVRPPPAPAGEHRVLAAVYTEDRLGGRWQGKSSLEPGGRGRDPPPATHQLWDLGRLPSWCLHCLFCVQESTSSTLVRLTSYTQNTWHRAWQMATTT